MKSSSINHRERENLRNGEEKARDESEPETKGSNLSGFFISF